MFKFIRFICTMLWRIIAIFYVPIIIPFMFLMIAVSSNNEDSNIKDFKDTIKEIKSFCSDVYYLK